MRRSFKYRLWTNADQERELGVAMETHRRLYNECLSLKQMARDCVGVNITAFDFSRWFTGRRKINPHFARLTVSSTRGTIERLDNAYRTFFRRTKDGLKAGFPRTKSPHAFNSIQYPDYGNGIRLRPDGRLYVQFVGNIRVKLHRPLQGKGKSTTLLRRDGKWYVIISCDLPDVPVTITLPAVGIDVGLESFLTTSDGESEPNPRFLKHALPELRRRDRAFNRKKKKGGKNRLKALRALRKTYADINNRRREHHHQVAGRLIRRYGLIAVECLNIHGMIKSGRMSRSVSDAAWGGFLKILHCKAESAGVRVVGIDPRGTSQQCSGCHLEVPKALKVRRHDCPHCGLSLHRDLNAALNILARGLAWTRPAGLNVGQSAVRAPRSRSRKATEQSPERVVSPVTRRKWFPLVALQAEAAAVERGDAHVEAEFRAPVGRVGGG